MKNEALKLFAAHSCKVFSKVCQNVTFTKRVSKVMSRPHTVTKNVDGFFFRSMWACLAMVALLIFLPSVVQAATTSGNWPAGQVRTQTANIPTPSGVMRTSFASTSGPWNYMAYPFTVSVSGNYTATATTAVQTNTTWIVRGTFVPGNPTMGTALADFIAGTLSGSGGAPYATNLPNVPLIAGQQYTLLVAHNSSSVAGELSTVTITGAGCVSLGSSTCAAASIPTLSEWGMLLTTGLMAIAGIFVIRRKSAMLK